MQRLCETIILVDSGSLLRYTLTRSVRLLADTFHTIYWRSHELLANGVRRGITTCSTGVKAVVVVFCFDKNGPPLQNRSWGLFLSKQLLLLLLFTCLFTGYWQEPLLLLRRQFSWIRAPRMDSCI